MCIHSNLVYTIHPIILLYTHSIYTYSNIYILKYIHTLYTIYTLYTPITILYIFLLLYTHSPIYALLCYRSYTVPESRGNTYIQE